MLTHVSRQLQAWLIFNVRQEMKIFFSTLFVLVGATGCATAQKEEISVLPYAPRFVDNRPVREALSASELEAFQTALAKVSFPQPGGTIEKMLPAHIASYSETVGDVLIDPKGLLAVYNSRFDLSNEYELILIQEHYSLGFVDRSAILRKKTPNQALEPTPTAVTPRADARVAPAAGVAHL